MHEVQTFLRETWGATESALAAARAAAERARAAKDVKALQQKIATAKDEIARGWKEVGIAVAIQVGLILVVLVFYTFGGLFELLGIPFGLAGMIGWVVLAVMMLRMLLITIESMWRIAHWKAEVTSRQAGR